MSASAPAIVALSGILAVNSYIDPLWILPPVGDRPYSYCVKDERQNKVNRAIRGERADGLLLGTSRAAFVNASLFRKNVVFNMAVNGAQPSEMTELARVFVRHRPSPKIIYAAYDFATYKDQGEPEIDPQSALAIRKQATEAARLLYPLDRLLDWEVKNYAVEVRDVCSAPDFPYPTYGFRGARRIKPVVHDEARRDAIRNQAAAFARDMFGKAVFTPDKGLPAGLKRLKDVAPASRIVAVVLPTTAELFLAGMGEGRIDDYFDWLRILLEAFGSVRHFDGLNGFTRSMENFFDPHHLMPDRAEAVVEILEGRAPPREDGFGELLTQETLPAFRRKLTEQVCRELGRSCAQ